MRVFSFIERFPVGRFNLACAVFALLWIVGTAPISLRFRPTFQDFPQFYMGGVVARAGAWESLYPVPLPGITANPGLSEDGVAKPRYVQLRKERRVPDYTRPITPPPTQLLFLPFAWLEYRTAYFAWAAVLSLCVWGVALQAGRLYRILAGRTTHWEGILAVLIVLSPTAARSIRITNVTPVVALCIGWIVIACIRGDRFRTGVAIVLGATMKYATLVLLPVLLLGRRWRTLAGAAVVGLALVGVTVAVSGVGPFREFATQIAPTLGRGHLFPGNQSLGAMLGRIEPWPAPPRTALALLKVAQLAMLGVIGLLFLRRPAAAWRDPVIVSAGAAALVSWLLIFSPISWEHYPIFLAPLAGWMLWEADQSRARFWTVMVAGLFLNLPFSILHVQGFSQHPTWIFPEPLNSTQLIAAAMVFVLALRRVRPAEPGGASVPAGRRIEFEMDRPAAGGSTPTLEPTAVVS
jgi:hypothetical protein